MGEPLDPCEDDADLTRAVLLAYRDYKECKQAGSIQSAEQINIAQAAADCSLKWNEGDWPGRKKGRRPIDIGNATEAC
jgi:hypothetical protein